MTEKPRTREETEKLGRRLLALRAEREALLSKKASKKDALQEIHRLTSIMGQSDKEKMKEVLSNIRTGEKLDEVEFRKHFTGSSANYISTLVESVAKEVEFGDLDQKDIAKRVKEIEQEEAKLASELEYSSYSPYWPKDRRVRNEFGQMCDVWFPAKKPIPICDWSLNRWLECLKKENTPIAAGMEK